MIITALMFQRSLLKIWEYNIKLDNVLKVLLGGLALVLVLTFIPDEKVFQYPLILLIVISIPLAFYNNLDAIRRDNVTAVVHMSAMAVFLIGATILLLRELWPSFPNNAFTGSAYKIGLIGQALLMSLSLTHRYNQIKMGKEEAQHLAITNLVRAEQIKDDLLANVSHELRTPFYGINGLAEAALEEIRQGNKNHDLIVQNLELIQSSGDRLTKLVNDLLDFSSAKEGTAYIKFKPVDLHSLVTLVIAVCHPLIGIKKLDLRIRIFLWSPVMKTDYSKSSST